MIINGTEATRQEVLAAMWADYAAECHPLATTFGSNPYDTAGLVWACEEDGSCRQALTAEQDLVAEAMVMLSNMLDGGLKYGV